MAWLSDFFNWYHDNGIIPNLWKGFTGQLSAEKQNEQNLDFQNKLLEYQKGIQQQIFDREDTAFERAYNDANKFGINPMAMIGSSAGAGSPVPMSAPQSSIDYSQFSGLKGLETGISALGTVSELSNAIDNFKTGNINRDILREEQKSKKLANAVFAIENGLSFDKEGNIIYDPSRVPQARRQMQDAELKDKTAFANRNARVDDYQDKNDINDNTTHGIKTIVDTSNFIDNSLPEDKSVIRHIFGKDVSLSTKIDMLVTYFTGKERTYADGSHSNYIPEYGKFIKNKKNKQSNK